MFMIAPVSAALIALAHEAPVRHPHAHRVPATAHAPRRARPSAAIRAAAQSRVVQLERLALLVRREALLRDFLIRARTEKPTFTDDRLYKLDPGIEIDETRVAMDFIGSPIIRARVRNRTASRQALLLEAEIRSVDGIRSRAGAALTLEPGETRTVELLCPSRIAPASLIWSTSTL